MILMIFLFICSVSQLFNYFTNFFYLLFLYVEFIFIIICD